MSLDRDDDADRILDLFRRAVDHDPAFTEAHREIISLTSDKQWLREDYERRVRETPNSAVFHYLLGEVSEGETKRIKYEKAIEMDPQYRWSYVGLGELLEGLGSLEEALQNYRKMISELPDEAEGYWGLLRTYRKAERHAEATSLLQQIYKRFKNDPDEGPRALFQIAVSLKDPAEKARLWHRYIEDYPMGPIIERVHINLIKHYVETDPIKAETFARATLEKEDLPDELGLKFFAYRSLFGLYWKAGKAEKEARLVDEFLESGYPDPYSYIDIADHYAKEGEVELAIRFYERALDFSNPDSVLATGRSTKGKPSQELLEEMAGRVRAVASYELGKLLNENRSHQEAVRVLRAVADSPDILGDRIHFELAAAYEATGTHPEAMEHYATSLIDHLYDPAREPLESLFETVQGSTQGLPQFVLDHVSQAEAEGNVVVSVPTSLGLDKAILRARGLSSGEAPELDLETLDGESIRSADLRGNVAVLNFWATWCGPCIQELPRFQATVDRWSGRSEVAFLAISVDKDDDVVRKFMEKTAYDFRVARNREAGDDYGVSVIPTLVLIGREGRIQYRHVGFDSEVDLVQKLSDEIEYLLQAKVS